MTAYLDTVLSGELNELQSAHAGRNNTLFAVAARLYQFVEVGAWSEDTITDQLTSIAHAAGLARNEIRATLKSAYKRAAQMDESTRAILRSKVSGNPAHAPASNPIPPEACEPPAPEWQAYAGAFVDWAMRHLWRSNAQAATQRDYLYGRGLTNLTITDADLGFNPADMTRSRATWGLAPDEEYGDRLWLPAGIVIPWYVDGALWRVSIRRPIEGPKKYYNVPGSSNALYGVDALVPRKPAALVEGVFDALAIRQEAGDVCSAVASGTTGARRARWMARLALCYPVLIAYDDDPAGKAAAAWWMSVLAMGRYWRPLVDDPAKMLEQGADIRGWIEAGLESSR